MRSRAIDDHDCHQASGALESYAKPLSRVSLPQCQHIFAELTSHVVVAKVLTDGKGNRAIVSLDWKGTPHPEWLLTGYERGVGPAPGTRVGVPGTP